MKELLGIDQYQIMTSTRLLHYWTLSWIAFSFLEEIRNDLKQTKDCRLQRESKTEGTRKDGEDLNEYQKEHHATLGQARRTCTRNTSGVIPGMGVSSRTLRYTCSEDSCPFSSLSTFYEGTAKKVHRLYILDILHYNHT